ncbi:single-stranded DNA-binding protein [Cellulomonas sp. PhB143]|uniref:single-stranded DNA-binding protein n=1 Tax=Cellulomonas sp. PhB143 TaxID=2485186 RepID=UPI000F49EF3C|nr:single-stranded DNA-binding protein [Cellulomonas sp. PhB143]
MSDVTVTLAGFVGTTPRLFTSQNGTAFTSFRIAATRRYLDRARGEWTDGRTLWFTVKAWRQTAENVASSLRKGDAVVVTGRLSVDEWAGAEGPRTDLVVEASALGPDLSRGTAHFAHRATRKADDDGGDAGEAGHGTAEAGTPEPGAGPEDDPFAVEPESPPADPEAQEEVAALAGATA